MKRFIAGAVCPNCQALDRLVLEIVSQEKGDSSEPQMAEEKRRTCVSCGFSDTAGGQGQSSMPLSRIERSRQSARHLASEDANNKEAAQIVKIIDPRTAE